MQASFSKEQAYYKENETIPEDELKNPYLKKDDIPKIELVGENKMIYEGENYKIDEYLNRINKNYDNFLDDSIY